ncbi:MAG: PspC domain-containing protein [Sphingobacteriales bacterium]|nr:PspC domain-containing protein [Sphingobacteriales bacterium]
MIKTFNINLAGQIFNINEDAYEHLSGYFSSLRSFYNDEEEKDEIIRDIESRFAELFMAKGKNYIITKADAAEVVNMMGNPQEFDEEKTQQSQTASSSSSSSAAAFSIGKRLYRDPDNSLVAGVCSGISNYFGIADPIWVRLGFILITIITGFGFGLLAYPILWFIMPEAVTSTQKLEMKGEAVNLSNIEKQLKDETPASKPKGVFGQLIVFLGAGVLLFFKFLLWIGIACAVLIGGVLLFAFFITMIVLSVLAIVGVPFVNTYFFENTSNGWFLGLGGILVGIIPIIFGIVALVHITSKKVKPLKKQVVFPLIGLFLFGLVLLNISGYNAKKLIAEKQRINQTYPLNYGYKSDTLQLMINPTIKDEEYNDVYVNGITDLMNFISDHNDKFFPVEIEIFPSLTDSFSIIKEFSANGKTDKDAIKNATSFSHSISQINNKLIIDPYIQFENNMIKFRNQKLKVKVFVPEGKIIRWDERAEKYMDEGKLVVNWDNVKNPNGIQINIPVPPTPPVPPNISIKIDTKNKNVTEELEKAKAELENAAAELESQQAELEDSLDQEFHVRLQREHYIFRMQNGELIAID